MACKVSIPRFVRVVGLVADGKLSKSEACKVLDVSRQTYGRLQERYGDILRQEGFTDGTNRE